MDIDVGGSLSASAGQNLVAQGVNANVGGSTSLRAGQDMQLTTALRGHVNTFDFYNKYKSAGDLLKISQRIDSRDIDLKNSGNSWSSGGGVNLSAGNNLSLVGAQIKGQGYSASAGGSYQERAAYDVKENVHIETTKRTGFGVYLADATNNTLAITTLGEQGGKTEKDRTETHIDSTRTAIVTDINAGAGAVNRNAGGDVLIEGSIVRGGEGLVDPVNAGGKVTAVAAVDTRHVEDSVFTSTIRWQSTKSTGRIEQTLHMPEIHGLPAHMSAYQGAGGVSVQLPAGSNVRTAIETLSQKPGQGYLKELGKRSDIDWQRVEELNKSLDFSKSGLTQEATIVVIIVVSILTYGAASSAGTAAATSANMTTTAAAGSAGASTVAATGAGVAGSGVAAGAVLTTTGAAVASAVTAGLTSLASTAAVSLINNKGDIGATLKELGSEDNAKGLLLTMATAGLSNGILNQVGLSGVDANSTVGQLFARNTIQGITSAVLESAVMGTSLEEALKNNLKGALINTVAAQGADEIGDAQLGATSKALAHALLGCAMGAATAGSSSGCAPGATGAVIGEIVAGLYADASGYDQLKIDANKPGASTELKQQLAVVTNTMTELAKLTGAGGALLIGGDASTMQTAMTTAQNAAVNNRQLHPTEAAMIRANAERYAQLRGDISVDQAEAELSQQALRNMDTAHDTRLGSDNAQAQAFLQELGAGSAQTDTLTGQSFQLFTADAATRNNHAMFGQYAKTSPAVQSVLDRAYLQAYKPGDGQTIAGLNGTNAGSLTGSDLALNDAARDYSNMRLQPAVVQWAVLGQLREERGVNLQTQQSLMLELRELNAQGNTGAQAQQRRGEIVNQLTLLENEDQVLRSASVEHLKAMGSVGTTNPVYHREWAEGVGESIAASRLIFAGMSAASINGRINALGQAIEETKALRQTAKAEADAVARARVENNFNAENVRNPIDSQSSENIAASQNLHNKAVADQVTGTYNPHYDFKHGPSTTLQQQYDRAMTGANPQTGTSGKPADASKFFNSTDMEAAIKQAEAAYAANPTIYPDRLVEVKFNRPVGEGYTGATKQNQTAGIPAGEYRWSNTATVGVDKNTGRAYTAYPNVTQGVPRLDPLKMGVQR